MLCRAVDAMSTQHNLYVWTSRIFIFCARKIQKSMQIDIDPSPHVMAWLASLSAADEAYRDSRPPSWVAAALKTPLTTFWPGQTCRV